MKRLKAIYNYLQRRYGAMWTLLFFAMLSLALILMQLFGLSANWGAPDGDKYIGWMYACNLVSLLVISSQLLRLDCRRLLSQRTANILDTCGSIVILLMLIRNHLANQVTSVNLDETPFYSEDGMFMYLLGFILLFCAKLVSRAAKLKEEQDLTI